MKLGKITLGTVVSSERRYSDSVTCIPAAEEFGRIHPSYRKFYFRNGISFEEKTTSRRYVEHRFAYFEHAEIIAPLINYCLVLEDGKPVTVIDRLREIYYGNPNSIGNYKPKSPPEEEGIGDNGYSTARCIMEGPSPNMYSGLIINPPFPNGHPLHNFGKKHTVKRYLPILIGIMIGFAVRPIVKELNELFGKARRY